MNKFLKEFKERGFFYQCTGEDNLSKLMDKLTDDVTKVGYFEMVQ